MSGTPFLGEIRMGAYQFAPKGWAMCDGQLMSIVQNQALFAILGTMYGGDGRTTFGLPNLQGRVLTHFGSGAGLTAQVQGQLGGTEGVTLTTAQMPAHSHPLVGRNGAGTTTSPVGNLWANSGAGVKNYSSTAVPAVQMGAGAVQATGGSQPHNNMQPSLVMNYIIALTGIFPSRS